MAAKQTFSFMKLSLGITVPLLIDLAYQEAYLVPSTIPNFYNKSRLEELSKPAAPSFSIPSSLTFTRYRTENPWHVPYVHAKKSFWRYNVMWFFVGVVSSAFQVRHAMTSWMARRTLGIFAAFGATGLTWAAIILEGNARKMYLDEMQDKVLKEEKAFYS